MTRRTNQTRLARRDRRAMATAVGATLALSSLVGGLLISPASAEDEISIETPDILVASPGSIASVAVESVPSELIGEECDLRVVAENGSSVHPGNALIASTGESRTIIEDVEDRPDGAVSDVHRVVLGDTITIEMRMGSDGASSLGFVIGIDCTPATPVPVEPAEQTGPPDTIITNTSVPENAPPDPVAPTTTVTPGPTVLPGQQTPLPESPPADPTVGNPTFTG